MNLPDQVTAALKSVYDPEIPVNIVDLGLIYGVAVNENGEAHIRMTLTAPSCPVAETIPGQVESAARTVPGITAVNVELVWDPPWDRSRMSDAAKIALGFDLGFDTVAIGKLQS